MSAAIRQAGDPKSLNQNALNCGPSEKVMNLAEKVATLSGQYLQLCAEYQVLSKNGYVPLAFEQKLTAFSKVEHELLADANERIRDTYKKSVSQEAVLVYLQKTEQVEACSQRVTVDRDGNCGLHALAVGLVNERNQTVLKNLEEVLARIPECEDKNRVLEGFAGLHTADDSARLLRDRNFMHSLARVLRQVGHEEVPKHIKATYGNILTGKDRKIIEELVPAKDGKWIEAEGLLSLANLIGMKVCVDVRGKLGERLHLQGELTQPDFVIRHQSSHFTPFLKPVN